MPADITDVRYVRIENLWHLATDYFYFTGSKAGELVANVCLNSRSVAHFLTYADSDDVSDTIMKAKASSGGVAMAVQALTTDNEREALVIVLRAIGNILDGNSDLLAAEQSYDGAVEALKGIIPSDPAVKWEATCPTFYWTINEWIDEVPILVEQKEGVWHWSLSRKRDSGTAPTLEAAMRAGEKALGWSEKPVV